MSLDPSSKLDVFLILCVFVIFLITSQSFLLLLPADFISFFSYSRLSFFSKLLQKFLYLEYVIFRIALLGEDLSFRCIRSLFLIHLSNPDVIQGLITLWRLVTVVVCELFLIDCWMDVTIN